MLVKQFLETVSGRLRKWSLKRQTGATQDSTTGKRTPTCLFTFRQDQPAKKDANLERRSERWREGEVARCLGLVSRLYFPVSTPSQPKAQL